MEILLGFPESQFFQSLLTMTVPERWWAQLHFSLQTLVGWKMISG